MKAFLKERDAHNEEKEKAIQKDDKSMIQLLEKKDEEFAQKLLAFPKEARQSISNIVDETAIAETVSTWTGIPVSKLSEENLKNY